MSAAAWERTFWICVGERSAMLRRLRGRRGSRVGCGADEVEAARDAVYARGERVALFAAKAARGAAVLTASIVVMVYEEGRLMRSPKVLSGSDTESKRRFAPSPSARAGGTLEARRGGLAGLAVAAYPSFRPDFSSLSNENLKLHRRCYRGEELESIRHLLERLAEHIQGVGPQTIRGCAVGTSARQPRK